MELLVNNHSVVGVKELNEVLKNYRTGIEPDGTVTIRFANPITRLNIVFVAGLFLLYRERRVRKYELHGSILEERKREIVQYIRQLDKLHRVTNPWIRFHFLEGVKARDVLYSSSFAPILYVSSDTLGSIFQKLNPNTDIETDLYKKTAFTYIERLSNRKQVNAFEKAFFKSQDGTSIKESLRKKPFLHIIVFCLLCYKDKLKEVIFERNPEQKWTQQDFLEFKHRFDELDIIAEDYFHGFHELAKNIVIHSSHHTGIITFRAYDTGENGKDFESFVFDYGDKGIIQTLVKGTDKLIKRAANASIHPEELKKDLTEDRELLSRNYHLRDFLTPSPTTILKQQMARQFVHIGLMTFNELITENNGTFFASTMSSGTPDLFSSTGEMPAMPENTVICRGTCFHAQLPMDSPRPRQQGHVYKEPGGMTISRKLTEIVHYHIEDVRSPIEKLDEKSICPIHLADSPVLKIGSREHEQSLVDYIYTLTKSIPDFVTLAIDFNKIELEPSSLLRILACVSGILNERLIVYNVNCSLLDRMVRENQRFLKWLLTTFSYRNTPYWIDKKAILLYSYLEVPEEGTAERRRFHFADILYGKDRNEFLSANRTISYSFQNIITLSGGLLPDKPISLREEASQFFAGDALLPFDILLSSQKESDRDCLFLENLRILLQKEFEPRRKDDTDPSGEKKEPWEEFFDILGGFSINNTHFRVGIKYHSSRFIFAKGVFQNSYHTTRIALLLVQSILKDKPKASDHITLVGYEMYSELLLGLTEDLMQELGYKDTDHFLVRDSSDGLARIQNPPKGIDRYYIIVPIVSTGSTSLRILRWMNNNLHVKSIPRAYFHLIAVVDPQEIQKISFSWEGNPPAEFIRLHTTWYDPSTCPFCFKDKKTPLIEADKTSISPAMVYSLPRVKHTRALSVFQNDIAANRICPDGYYGCEFSEKRFQKSLLYKCDGRNGENNLFSHDEILFIKHNRDDIIHWLQELRKSLALTISDKVVIIAPSSVSNIAFINLVNTYLFGYSATILYLQDNDYIENFKLTAEPYLKDKRSHYKVVFVDDSIITGRSLGNTYSLINVIESEDDKEEQNPFTFFTTVVLINKATADVTRRISKLTDSLHCFMSVNLPGSMTISEKKPFELEIERYKELKKYCLFDQSKLHYSMKINELEQFTKSNENRPYQDKKEDRHLKMLGATHRLLEHFQVPENQQTSFKSIVKVAGYDYENDRYSVFKTLCQPPFILHSDILKAVFKWHTACLNELIAPNMPRNQVDIVKFMIRRAVFIKNYQVISQPFFQFLADVFRSESTSTSPKEKSKYNSLQYFILRQYTELIRLNGWCAGQILESLTETKSFSTSRGRQFKRMLMDSIGIVLHDFLDMLDSTPVYKDWKTIGFENSEEDVKSFFGLSPVNPNSLLFEISKTNKYQIVKNAIPDLFLKEKESTLWDDREEIITHGVGIPNGVFTRFLYIVACLRHDVQADSSASSLKLKDKTCILLENIRNIFGDQDSVGAFLIVKNRRNDRTVVYDRDTDECHILTDSFLADKSEGTFLQVFLDYDSRPRKMGEVDIYSDNEDFRTIVELVPKQDNIWKNRYASKETYGLPMFSGYKWMYVLRLESLRRKHENKEISPTGILCVYGKDEKSIENDLGRKLLLLMRSDLSKFVHYHHRNDEFIDLIVAERTERFAYLAGHGRVVMQMLTKYGDGVKWQTEEEEQENHRIRDAFSTVVRAMERMQYMFAMNIIDRDAPKCKNQEALQKNYYFEVMNDGSLQQIKEDLTRMAAAIYSSDIVEIQEPVDLSVSVNGGPFSIKFCKDILMMIAFELIWNAKKNRFHMVRDLCSLINLSKDFKNTLDVNISIIRKQVKKKDRTALVLTVKGTGPKVDPGIITKIKNGGQLKPDELNSGLEMIQKVLIIMDEDNNLEITSTNPVNSVFTNTVTVEIYA